MTERIVHLCYAGTSGSARAAVNIAAGSADPTRHAYVFYGACELRADYTTQLDELGATWRYVHKPRGLLTRAYRRVGEAVIEMAGQAVSFHGSRSLPVASRVRHLAPHLAIIAVQHGPSSELTSRLRRKVCERFGRLADLTITVSAGMAELIDKHLHLSPPPTVITNGVDVDYWAAPPTTRTPQSPLRLIMVATLSPHKGQADLLHALAQLTGRAQDVTLTLVGGGPEEKLIRSLVHRLGVADRVALVGDLSRDGVRAAIHAADVLVHPSHSESFGMSVLEAMASSRCVVASNCVGVRDLIRQEQTGLRTPVGDVDAIARTIERLRDDPRLAEHLAGAGRHEAVSRHSHRQMAQRYERAVEDLLAERGHS